MTIDHVGIYKARERFDKIPSNNMNCMEEEMKFCEVFEKFCQGK
jgi:hypothetical protein